MRARIQFLKHFKNNSFIFNVESVEYIAAKIISYLHLDTESEINTNFLIKEISNYFDFLYHNVMLYTILYYVYHKT